jgi:hypothetical protein
VALILAQQPFRIPDGSLIENRIAPLRGGAYTGRHGGDARRRQKKGDVMRAIRFPAIFLAALPAAMMTAQDVNWTLGAGFPQWPNLDTIALDPEVPTTIWTGGDAALFRSTDAGLSWLALGAPDAPHGVGQIAIDPAIHSTVYAGLDAIFRSDDGGGHWSTFEGPGNKKGWFTNAEINALAVDPDGFGRPPATGSPAATTEDRRFRTQVAWRRRSISSSSTAGEPGRCMRAPSIAST